MFSLQRAYYGTADYRCRVLGTEVYKVNGTDCLEGWLRHSRDIGTWSTDRPPIVNWLAHVRGVIKDAVA